MARERKEEPSGNTSYRAFRQARAPTSPELGTHVGFQAQREDVDGRSLEPRPRGLASTLGAPFASGFLDRRADASRGNEVLPCTSIP